MSQQLTDVNLMKMKNMFLIFLKQFDVKEYTYLMQFLQIIITKYDVNPSQLFSYLTNQAEEKDDQYETSSDDCINNDSSDNKTSDTEKKDQYTFRKSQTPIFMNSKKCNQNKFKLNQISESQSISSFSCNTDSNSSSSIQSSCKQEPSSGEQATSELQNENDSEEIDYSDEPNLNYFASNKMSKKLNKNNQPELIDSFRLKDENTNSIDEFISNNDENEPICMHENEDEQDQCRDNTFWERFDPNTQQPNELAPILSKKIKNKLKNRSLLNNTSEYLDATQINEANLNGVKTRIRKFSDNVRTELEAAFLIKNFISGAEKYELAKRLGLTERQVQKWFVHRREKLRRLEKKTVTLNSPIDNCNVTTPVEAPASYNSQIRSITSIIPNNMDYKPKLASKSIIENPYQKVYHNYRQIKTDEQNLTMNNFDESNVDVEEENYLNETDNLNENEYYDQSEEENNWNDNNDNYNNNNFKDEPNCTSEDFSTVINQTYDYHENSDYLNDFENSEVNNTNFGEISENYDDDSKFDHSILNNQLFQSEPIKRQPGTKGPRRLFPPDVITHLEKVFDTEKYLKECQVEEIALVTKLSEKQIRSWFKQRRYRYNQESRQNGHEADLIFKRRDSLSQAVVVELEEAFQKNNYILGENKKILSKKLELKPIQLERWFYYRRKKDSPTTSNLNTLVETDQQTF